MFVLFNALFSLVIAFIEYPVTTFSTIYAIVMAAPGLAATVRRLHDTDRSGWWCLVPLANLYFLSLKETSGDNQFGPEPKDDG
jgi:uncharacterized membrane protein YhaH (DUF805 family)|tara:strand:+ start:1093 stop:1341 length:249 start_codon:yes stop_codon:yes gene_type:complete